MDISSLLSGKNANSEKTVSSQISYNQNYKAPNVLVRPILNNNDVQIKNPANVTIMNNNANINISEPDENNSLIQNPPQTEKSNNPKLNYLNVSASFQNNNSNNNTSQQQKQASSILPSLVNNFNLSNLSSIGTINNINVQPHIPNLNVITSQIISSNNNNNNSNNKGSKSSMANKNSQNKQNRTNNYNNQKTSSAGHQHTNDLKPPEPVFYEDKSGKFGIRCVCGEGANIGRLVQCKKCEMWLHAACVNYPRENYTCPFCLKNKISCVCGKSMKYDEPLIQCTKCGNWSHKTCENIEFGIIPNEFSCRQCRSKYGLPPLYEIPYIKFDESDTSRFFLPYIPDITVNIDVDRDELLKNIPDGFFKNMIENDLNSAELHFHDFLERYFHKFSQLLFDRGHEFFKIFNETVCSIFKCDKNYVLGGLDYLATKLLYKIPSEQEINEIQQVENNSSGNEVKVENETLHTSEEANNTNKDETENSGQTDDESVPNEYKKEVEKEKKKKSKKSQKKIEFDNESAFSHSESITQLLETTPVPRLEKEPSTVQIYIGENGNGVYSPSALEDGAYITEIPGFLLHTDEVQADEGIPRSCLMVTDNEVIMETKGTSFHKFSMRIRRSFHFNCIIKIVRVRGEMKVALFATRMKGPLSEEKIRRGDAIAADGELILPFDGDIPFSTERIEWKERKKRKSNLLPSTQSQQQNANKPNAITPSKQRQKKKITQQTVAKRCVLSPNLTLLSAFLEDSIPPMPFIVLSDEEDIEIYKMHMEKLKSRVLSQ